ncbi:MAG: ABC transporter substrate-binding protein [Desulfobulbaceae bacterium]|nr:ABC transporter substrate-binding protein [Desulfobulbaceae bacterium]
MPLRVKQLLIIATILLFSSLPAFSRDTIVLQLRWDHQFQFAGYYAADWQGYYDEAGIDVIIRPAVMANSPTLSATKEVAEGRADFGIGAADILIARDQGADLRVTASIFQHSATEFYALHNTKLDSPEDLAQLKISRIVNNLPDIEYQALLRSEGIDPGSRKYFPHQPELDHLLTGKVDVIPGYSISIPFEAQEKGILLNSIKPSSYGINFYGDSLFVSGALADRDPDLVHRFTEASLKGWQYAIENSDELTERIDTSLLSTTHLAHPLAFNQFQSKQVRNLIRDDIITIGHTNPLRWKKMFKSLKDTGVITNKANLPENFVFDREHIHELLAEKQQTFSNYIFIAITLVATAILLFALFLKNVVRRRTSELSLINSDLKEKEEHLLNIQNELNTIFRDTPLIMLLINEKFLVHKANRMATEKVLRTETEITGLRGGEALRCIHAKDDPQGCGFSPKCDSCVLRNTVKKTFATQRPQDNIESQFFTKAEKETAELTFLISTVPMTISGKKMVLFCAHDISSRKKVENQLLQAYKTEAIGTLAGGIAHDFNNILSLIVGYTEMAQDDILDQTDCSESLDNVLVAAGKARDLVQQILAFSRQTEIERIPLKLSTLIKELLLMLRSTLPTTIVIEQDIDHNCGIVIADASQVQQIFMNLCTNSFQAMEQTGGTLRIELRKSPHPKPADPALTHIKKNLYAELVIGDNGPGITPRVLSRIFDPYYTTKAKGKGTGMGLAIVHSIVSDHGGFVTVNSQEDIATEFHVFLPLTQTHQPAEKQVDQKTTPGGSERILYIDDEPGIVNIGKTMLERVGYHVTAITDGQQALKLFTERAADFDLIITDQTMTGITGAELTIEVKKIRADIPVILCTGYSTIISEEDAIAIGVSEFAYKPLNKENIATLIRQVLDRQTVN